MSKVIRVITVISSGIIGLIFGGMCKPLKALLIMMAIDYATGVMAAVAKKCLSSAVGAKGIAKKGAILAVVAVGHIVGYFFLNSGEACRNMVIGFYVANEGISILENVHRLGVPLPKKLVDILAQLKNSEEDKNAKN